MNNEEVMILKLINKITERRRDLGMSQSKLAQMCGMTQPAIARLENYKVIPSLETLFKVINSLGLEIKLFEK